MIPENFSIYNVRGGMVTAKWSSHYSLIGLPGQRSGPGLTLQYIFILTVINYLQVMTHGQEFWAVYFNVEGSQIN